MKRHIQTRAHARSLDYDWLGEQPEQRWWERYKPFTFFEHRTLIVEGNSHGWRLYASAIPSARRDAVGTDIWHTVILGGSVSEETETEEAHRVLGAALLERDELGPALDEQFDQDFVAACLSGPGNYADDVADRLTRAFASLSSRELSPKPMDKGDVAWGGIQSREGLTGLAERAAALITGSSSGVAALLNLVNPSSVSSVSKDLSKDLAEKGSTALLVEGSAHSWSNLPKAEPVPSASQGTNRRPLIILASVLVGLVVAGVVAYLIYRRLRSPH